MAPYWFGCEFEFCVAFVPQDNELPDKAEARNLRFDLGKNDSDEASSELISPIWSADSALYSNEKEESTDESASSSTSSKRDEQAMYDRRAISDKFTPAVQEDIAATLNAAGFQAFKASGGSDFSMWAVDTDGSINPHYLTQYHWAPIELISPATEFSPKSLEIVEKVLGLINNTYVTHTGKSTGLHVHISAGVRKAFKFAALRINVSNLFWFIESKHDREYNYHPPTIEFRGHEGTLEPARVISWIKTLVSIISFVDTADLESLTYLLQKALDEKWQKQGIDQDEELQAKFGPIPAEGDFTIIDLLRYMQLDELADFYSDKIYEFVGIPPIHKPRLWLWDYEQQYA